jgi:hypothetical protein
MKSDHETEQLTVTSATTWTVTKERLTIELTLEDIQHLLDRLVWSGDIMVFDEASGRCGGNIDEIGISLNGNAIQITLFKEENDGHENDTLADSTVSI